MRIVVLCPHFAPDVAPTGAVMTRVVEELATRGHELEVVTSLPWYREHRIERGYEGRLVRREDTPWGGITRLHPFPAEDKKDVARRAVAFVGFTALAALFGSRVARRSHVDAVLAVSPPLTLGLAGAWVARLSGAGFVFNVQDVYPDAAVALGVLKSRRLIRLAHALERACYRRADAVTVLSEDMRANVAARTDVPERVRVIPNFVDPDAVRPQPIEGSYRREHGLVGKTVVMYAGNVGLSQALDTVIDTAAVLTYESDLVFVIHGHGAARAGLEIRARGLPNVVFVDPVPESRLSDVLSAADIHLVPLKRGLARASVPSKIYSIFAAARPVIASVDEGSELARLVERAGAGLAVPPDDPEALAQAIARLAASSNDRREMGQAARKFIEGWASPSAVAERYETLFREVRRRGRQ